MMRQMNFNSLYNYIVPTEEQKNEKLQHKLASLFHKENETKEKKEDKNKEEKEDLLAAKAVIEIVNELPYFWQFEEASIRVHDEWKKRNPETLENKDQHIEFLLLEPKYSEKFRRHVTLARRILFGNEKKQRQKRMEIITLAMLLDKTGKREVYLDPEVLFYASVIIKCVKAKPYSWENETCATNIHDEMMRSKPTQTSMTYFQFLSVEERNKIFLNIEIAKYVLRDFGYLMFISF